VTIPVAPAEKRLQRPHEEAEGAFTLEMAMAEASRCLDCGVETVFDAVKCVLCGACAEVCPTLSLTMAPLREASAATVASGGDASAPLKKNSIILKDRDQHISFYPQVRLDANEDFVLFKSEEVCIRCGACAAACPTGTIAMKRIRFCDG